MPQESAEFWARTARYAHALLAGPDVDSVHEQHLRGVRELIDADAYGITALEPSTLTPLAVATDGLSDGFMRSYEDVGGRQRDVFFQYVLTKRRPVHDRILFPDGDWADRLSDYGRLMLEHGLTHAMLVPLVRHGALVGTLHFSRGRSRSPFTRRDMRVAGVIMGMAAGATSNALRYTRLQEHCTAAQAVVRSTAARVIVCDREGRIACQSDRAARMHAAADPELRRDFVDVLRRNVDDAGAGGEPVARRWDTVEMRTSRVAGTRSMLVTYLHETAPDRLDAAALVPPLTPREADVLECIAAGMRDQETATALGISINTVKRHLKHIYAKLGARGRAEAVSRAIVAARETAPPS